MKVLLSIKPKYAELIFSGIKKYEFRKAIFKEEVKTVIVYASSPVQKVIGEFQIESILSGTPDKLWSMTKKHSGVEEAFFDEYFAQREIGYAIKVKSYRKYKIALSLKDDFNLTPPQSFMYLHK